MKHFMQPRNTTLREIHIPSSSDASPNPGSTKFRSTPSRRQIISKENTPPDSSSTITGKPLMIWETGNLKSPLPPRPPNPRKRKLLDAVSDNLILGADSGVQVIVRTRPPKVEEEGEMIVKKISSDSLSINDQTLTFDHVAGTDATQLDIFQLVGAPLVENCLAGFNSSVFAYGQTGSGKTYTMWGPANALLEENLLSDQQGLTPRVFSHLFSRINEEQIKRADNQIKYLCRCSFLEIYNEQITDLLDPSQKNLQIREDVKSGVYVENLTEECVYGMKDVTQLLINGLSNRRTGATSINATSSRSHSVFTCVVESRCKSTADGISSLKTSKINLVDLAGSERQKSTGASGDRLKEAGNINRSLSQLGNLINILAEVSQTGKQRHIPYRDSRLTFLLQDSLGGNAKLAMLCAISPSPSCKSETFSTLRFAHRAKAVKNKAVVNEVMQDDVNVLREVIRGLKDELVRMKANGNSTDSNGGYSTGWNARRSLNLLKFSINHHTTFPPVDDEGDTEMEIVEEAVKRECAQLESEIVATGEVIPDESHPNPIRSDHIIEKNGENTQVIQKSFTKHNDKLENMILDCEKYNTNHSDCSKANTKSCCNQIEENHEEVHANLPVSVVDGEQLTEETKLIIGSDCKSNIDSHTKDDNDNNNLPSLKVCEISVDISEVHASNCSPPRLVNSSTSFNLRSVPCNVSPIKSPIQSVSPKVNNSRKSLRTSTKMTASGKDHTDGGEFGSDVNSSFAECFKSSASNALANQTSNNFHAPTDHLAASLHRGLEVIDSHCQSSSLRRPSLRFSLKPLDYKPLLAVEKVNVGVQTLPQDNEIIEGHSPMFLCSNCKCGTPQLELRRKTNYISDSQLVPVDGPESANKLKKQVPKAVEKVLAGAIRREMAVEELCSKQMAEITQLNRLVHQYRHERECNAIIGQMREDKIVRLECLMDGVLPTDEFIEEEFMSLKNEHKLLREKYENHPEVLTTKIELKRVQDELELYRNFHDLGEKDILLEEVQDLRNQLQCYMDSSVMSARKQNPPSLFTHSSRIQESSKESASDILEQERCHWTDSESKWISLTEELRTELQASRSLAVKLKQELDSEKKCAGELKEAMQMAMEGHARMLEQYAELQEKHIALLARHRKIQEGIDDVKKAAAKAGFRGSESKFINALAGEISALKVEREKERRYFRDENKGLQAQLRDTAEAVQAAGKLLVRLKEAEESVAAAQSRATVAAQETEKAYKQITKLKSKHEKEINILNQRLSKYGQPKELTLSSNYDDSNQRTYNVCSSQSARDQQRKEEFATLYNGDEGELSMLTEPSWFSGYDRCNI